VFIFYNFDFAGVAVWDGHTPFHTEFETWWFVFDRLVGEVRLGRFCETLFLQA